MRFCTPCCAFVISMRALDFYCNKLGLKETRRRVDEKNRYTLVFLAGSDDERLVERGQELKAGPVRRWNSHITGTPRTTARRAILAISLMRSTTSMPRANGS